MDFRRHVTAGRLSELFGESQVDTDAFIRLLGWRRTAEQELTMLDPTTVAYLEAYARGVNAYLADHHGVAARRSSTRCSGSRTPATWSSRGPRPTRVAWLKAMAWDLRGNMDREIERHAARHRPARGQVDQLYPPYPYDRTR